MANPVAQLRAAVQAGDAAAVEAALAAGADVNGALNEWGSTVLHDTCHRGHLACVRALLAAGADPNADDGHGTTPLHMACRQGHTQCIQALLAAGANPAAKTATLIHDTPLLDAVRYNRVGAIQALLKAAPELALLQTKQGELLLQAALNRMSWDFARCLLAHGALPPAAEVLALLEAAVEQWPWPHEAILPLYAPLVARQPLTPAEWARVPRPCPGLGALLPAVLARSEAEAALLVAHLPPPDRERLRTAALCMRRTERTHGLELPHVILRPLLLAAVE